tara:strand:+ start:346 stop:1332 length:987 start_codon:yes stop_codon:yes gene_type:complete
MSDMVAIVPNQEVLTSGVGVVGDFFMNPLPQVPLYQDMLRMAPFPVLYENINPAMAITVQSIGGCPLDKIPNLITSVTLVPGQGATGYTGSGNEIVYPLIDIADKPVPNIPDFLMPNWQEPRITYGSVAGPPSPTMTLVAPLRGYYGEKYFYDADYIYASYYANSPEFTGDFFEELDAGRIPDVNRLTHVSLLGGKRVLRFTDLPPDIDQIEVDYFPANGIPLDLREITPSDEVDTTTIGSDYLYSLIPEISSWVKWKPSFIKTMRYYYTLIVTHTCPPFVTTFQGSMIVENNWTPAANRLSYYIDKQIGFLDTIDGEFTLEVGDGDT